MRTFFVRLKVCSHAPPDSQIPFFWAPLTTCLLLHSAPGSRFENFRPHIWRLFLPHYWVVLQSIVAHNTASLAGGINFHCMPWNVIPTFGHGSWVGRSKVYLVSTWYFGGMGLEEHHFCYHPQNNFRLAFLIWRLHLLHDLCNSSSLWVTSDYRSGYACISFHWNAKPPSVAIFLPSRSWRRQPAIPQLAWYVINPNIGCVLDDGFARSTTSQPLLPLLGQDKRNE